MTKPDRHPQLCLVICGAGPAPHAGTIVGLAHKKGWVVTVVATPAAMSMIDADDFTALSGQPVRDDYGQATAGGSRPRDADAIIVAPATYNFINKLALGINDTYALNVVAEAIGRGTPVTILPFVNAALAARHPFEAAVESLRAEGVLVLLGPDQWMPHPLGMGDDQIAIYPWHKALAGVEAS